MTKKQLELLVSLQDLDIMIGEIDEDEALGFGTPGRDKLQEVRADLVERIGKPLMSAFERLRTRYKWAIVPVKDDTCLGCFRRLPTALSAKGRENISIITCEGCGRILYWLE
jgi:predicted  nucleic acid-binding Zn-ribbon protein